MKPIQIKIKLVKLFLAKPIFFVLQIFPLFSFPLIFSSLFFLPFSNSANWEKSPKIRKGPGGAIPVHLLLLLLSLWPSSQPKPAENPSPAHQSFSYLDVTSVRTIPSPSISSSSARCAAVLLPHPTKPPPAPHLLP